MSTWPGFNKAADLVRRRKHQELLLAGKRWLTRSKYDWLRHPNNFRNDAWWSFRKLKDRAVQVSRGWALKEVAMEIWDLHYAGAADRNFRPWFG